jgi:RimJ/RimL family protein N-acetyltransferase
MTPILETPRLNLRELVPDDLNFVATMLAHPDVSRFHERRFDLAAAQD